MNYLNIDFSGFNGRDEALEEIKRFNMERRTPMHYRTDLLLHSRRVYVLLSDIIPVVLSIYGESVNAHKTLMLALVHDDAEIITGDVQLYHKDRMSHEQLSQLFDNEARAIDVLSERWPNEIEGFIIDSYCFILCIRIV